MASPYKTSKSELVAIYRLEFYKKQKNWKYCSQERRREEEKRKAARIAKAKLNQTYNIEPAAARDTDPINKEAEDLQELKLEAIEEKEDSSHKEDVEEELPTQPSDEKEDNLNEAFVETETEDTPTAQLDFPGGLYSPKWSIQHWAAQCQPLWTQPTLDTEAYPTDLNIDPKYQSDPQCYWADVPHCSPELPHAGASVDARCYGQFADSDGHDQGWPVQSQVWTNRQDWFEGVSELPLEASAAGDAVDGPEWALLSRAQRFLGASEQGETGYCESLPSVSSGSFTRGAALAPHSSEADLQISGGAEAAGLSPAALAEAVARHAAALQALLGEARKRDMSTSPVNQRYSFDEYPTRDAGPSRQSVTSPPSDVIITGSFRNRPDLRGHTDGVGRGRGRLEQTPIIGIGRGRPYRI